MLARSQVGPPGLGFLCCLVVALCGLGSDAAQDGPRPPGDLYQVADTTIHVNCVGTGASAVVQEAGLGGNYLAWTYVQAALAETHKICACDRAGAGWSGRVITRDGRNAYVALGRADRVAVMDVATRKPLDYILAGKRPWGLRLTRDDRKLYVANGLSDDIAIVDTEKGRLTKAVPVGVIPYAILVDD